MRGFCLEVSGEYACFTRPEMKVERVSYDVITPSAARAIFDAILWKLRTRSPWYDMPSYYPSHQTCYRRYRQWKHTGILPQVLQALYRDLRDRGGLDFQTIFQDSAFRFEFKNKHWEFIFDPRLQGTWQLSTLMLFTSMMVQYLKSPSPTSPPSRGSQPPPPL